VRLAFVYRDILVYPDHDLHHLAFFRAAALDDLLASIVYNFIA